MILYIFLIILMIISFILLFQSYKKYKLQIELYNQAFNLSKKKNKKLLVIGDPIESSTNFLFGHYGYGDICVDMNLDLTNKNIPKNTILIKDKLENVLHNFKDDSVVIFESETLEYVDDKNINNIIKELYRISNYDIYSIHQLKSDSIFTYLKANGYKIFNLLLKKNIYNHKRLFKTYPPYNKSYVY